ncbi:MAG: hypothetical protein HDR22_02505 [Lachnospiraceae bacterium]|nr:hypothetical protein [Lachnospiraceae bacterium]
MKKKAFQMLLCGNLLILFPSIWIELIRYGIIPFECLKHVPSIMSFKWLNILILFTYGVLFSMPAMIIISISTLIIIEKELKKENLILFIWLILWLLNAIAILSSFDMVMFVARQ